MKLHRLIRLLHWKRNLNQNDCKRQSDDSTRKPYFNLTEKPKEFQEFYKITKKCLDTNCSLLGNNLFQRKVRSFFRTDVAEEILPMPKKYVDDCYILNNRTIDYENFLRDEILYFDNILSKSNNQKVS